MSEENEPGSSGSVYAAGPEQSVNTARSSEELAQKIQRQPENLDVEDQIDTVDQRLNRLEARIRSLEAFRLR